MTLEHKKQGRIDILSISGRLVMTNSPDVRTRTLSIIDEGDANLIIDLEHLALMDSSGFAILVSAYKAICLRGGRLVLANVSPEIMSLIELTRLNKILEIYPPTKDAVAALSWIDRSTSFPGLC